MSQSGSYLKGTSGGIPIETITGNTGGPVGPDGADNINLVGSGAITVAGNPGTNTLTISSSALTSISITGDTGGALTGNSFTFTGGTTGLTFNGAGTTETLGGDLVVTNGGTGAATFTSHGVLLGNGTSPITATAAGTTGQILTGVTGSAPTFQAPAASSITITGDSGGGLTGNSFTFTGGTTGLTFSGAGTTETLGGDLVVSNGGTGTNTLTLDGVLIGNGTSPVLVTAAGTTGQVLTGVTGSAPTFQAPAASSITITGDSGGPLTGSSFTFTGGTTGLAFSGSGTTETLVLSNINLPTTTSSVGQITIGGNLYFHSFGGTSNVFAGNAAGNLTTSGNTNAGFGDRALTALTSGSDNTAIGPEALTAATSANDNIAVGFLAGGALTTGAHNVLVGSAAGTAYTSSEASNIILGNSIGTAAENNVMRLGATGSGNGQQNKCFIAAVSGTTVTGNPVLCSSTGQLGTVTAGTNGQVFLGSTGASPAFGTLTSTLSSLTYTTGAASLNIDIANYADKTSWTPVLNFGGGTTGITYLLQDGTYTRIANIIFLQMSISLTSKGSSTGTATITGLPFAASAHQYTFAVNYQTITYTGQPAVLLAGSTSTIQLFHMDSAANLTALTNTSFGGGDTIRITGWYST